MAFTHSMTKYATFADALAGIKNTMVTAGWTATTDFATVAAGLSNAALNTAYTLGDMVLPTVAGNSNVILVCSQTGTTHASTAITPSSTFTGEVTSGTAKFKTIWKQAWLLSCTPSYTSPTGYLYLGGSGIASPTTFCVLGLGKFDVSNSYITLCPVANPYTLNSLTLHNSSNYTNVWADSTSVYVYYQTGGGGFFCGFPATDAVGDVTTVTAPATAGSSVSVSVANALKFQPNKSYRWYAADGSYREKVTVSSITNSTTIVISTLRTNIPSGAYFGSLPSLFLCSRCDDVTSFSICNLFDTSSVNDINSNMYLAYSSSSRIYTTSPINFGSNGYYNNKYPLYTPILFNLDYTIFGAMPDYFLFSTTGTTGDLFGINENYRGSASAGGNTTMTDGSATWTTNQWAGKRLCLTSGTGSGQTRAISSNTGTEITVTNAWATNPTSGTTYTICDSSARIYALPGFASGTTSFKMKEGN